MNAKHFIPFGILIFSTHALASSSCAEIKGLSDEQKDLLNISYHHALPYNLGTTVAAIAWQESYLGKYIVALDEGSVGIHHINIDSAIKRSGLKDTSFNRAYVATQIIKKPIVSTEYAIKELQYWRSQGRNWRDMVKSYNSGWSINDGQANKYLQHIREKVKSLSDCEHVWLKPYL